MQRGDRLHVVGGGERIWGEGGLPRARAAAPLPLAAGRAAA